MYNNIGNRFLNILLVLLFFTFNFWASVHNSPLLDDNRLPPLSKSSDVNMPSDTSDFPTNETQNLFESSISCGQSEFYVQLTFSKPFKGLLYAYRNASEDYYSPLHYPIQILDTCTLRGNGASVIYLELSFLSECVEKLTKISSNANLEAVSSSSQFPSSSLSSATDFQQKPQQQQPNITKTELNKNETFSEESEKVFSIQPDSKFNLDGFNFRRAIDEEQASNIRADEMYQLSLYVQKNANIEQKTDSRVTILCSSHVTKNIIYEQNIVEDHARKLDANVASSKQHKQQLEYRSFMPSAQLYLESYKYMNKNLTELGDIAARIDILRGRIPFVKPIERNVYIGDDLSLIVRVNQLDDFDSRISRCFAHEGNNTIRHELTNQQGCSVDESTMPSFKKIYQSETGSHVHYTSFSAFKFANILHSQMIIECRLLLCRHTCPEVSCK